MQQIQLEIQIRKNVGTQKARQVRRKNFIPGIIYGEEIKPTPVQTERKNYERVTRHHQAESLVFHLNIVDNGKKVSDYPAIVKEVQLDPVSDQIIHVDFQRISLDKEIEVKIPVVTKGDAIGVKRDSGTLDHHMWELDIICLPTRIPQNIEVDVTNLGIHDAIHVSDLKLPEGVRTKHDPAAVVVTVVGSIKEEVVVPGAEQAGPAEVEVIKEKKDKEGEAPAAKGKEGEAKKAPEAAKKEEKK